MNAAGRFNFPATRWSIVSSATGDDPVARAALAWLCERYWQPLCEHACASGWQPASAEDLVQQLLCEIMVRGDLAQANPGRGRFRTWLKACLDHLAQREREKRHALKRGGHAKAEALDPLLADRSERGAGRNFDRAWAQEVITRALDRLAALEKERGTAAVFAALRPYLTCDAEAVRYAEVGATLGLNESAVKVAVHRLRQRYGDVLRDEIAQTLADPTPEAVASELAALQAALSSS
jgi:DNA-directed RNA polymerase specialized sigma24 family protein